MHGDGFDYEAHRDQIRALSRQFGRYAMVGGTAFAIDFALMVLFTEEGGWDPVVSSLVSFVISLFVNYAMSMKWVFERRDDISRGKEFGIFAALAAIGLVMNEAIMAVGVVPRLPPDQARIYRYRHHLQFHQPQEDD